MSRTEESIEIASVANISLVKLKFSYRLAVTFFQIIKDDDLVIGITERTANVGADVPGAPNNGQQSHLSASSLASKQRVCPALPSTLPFAKN